MTTLPLEADELLPQDGKDEAYDAIIEEIQGLESKLEKQLKKLEDEVGYVLSQISYLYQLSNECPIYRYKLTYWHSAVGTKVSILPVHNLGRFFNTRTKDIYLVQTKTGQKNIPKNWTKQGGTKVSEFL